MFRRKQIYLDFSIKKCWLRFRGRNMRPFSFRVQFLQYHCWVKFRTEKLKNARRKLLNLVPNAAIFILERNLIGADFKVDGTSFQVFWICKLWKERTKSQLNVITKFVYDSIAKLVLVQKRQLFCHQLLPWQRYLMIVQTYFWASKAHILKTNLVTPNFFHIRFFVIWKWNDMII